VRIGDTLVVISNRNPLLLAAVSRTGETVEHLTQMLELVHETVLFFATEKPLRRLRSDPYFAIESSVAGTQPSIHHAIRFANRSPAITADAVPMLALPLSVRNGVAGALRSGASGTLATVLIMGGEIVAFTAQAKHPLRPRDLLLLIAFVQSSSSFRSSEAFVPLCLPGIAPEQFLHAHISCAVSAPRGIGRGGAAFAEPVSCKRVAVVAEAEDESAAESLTGASARGKRGSTRPSPPVPSDRSAITRGIASTVLAVSPQHEAASAPSPASTAGAPGAALSSRVASRVAGLRAAQAADPASSGLPRTVQAAAASDATATKYTRDIAGSFRADAAGKGVAVVSGEDAISMSAGRAGKRSATTAASAAAAAAGRDASTASAAAANAQALSALRGSDVVLAASAAPALMAAAEAHIQARAVQSDEETAMQRLEAFASDAPPPAPAAEAGADAAAPAGALGGEETAAEVPDFSHRLRSTEAYTRDDSFLVVIGTDITADAVTALRSNSSKVHEQLRKKNLLAQLRSAVSTGGREASSFGYPSIVHFVYFWKPLRQMSVGSFPVHMRSHRARKRLLRRYQHLWADVTCSTPSVRYIVTSSPDGTLGAINTTNAIVLCLTAGGGAAGGAPHPAGPVVKLMEDFARVLKSERSALLQERGLVI
jgi:hypothetical protein